MADPVSYSKPHVPLKELHSSKPITRTNKSSSSSSFTSNILCKSLFCLLFLVLIPLFPSQAPDFISQSTIFTKFWDLAHLLFIGLAVCYGLFSRRNVEDFDFEPPPQYPDDSQSSYVSRIFHVSPIFEDGSENSSGFDDKNVYQNWNSQYYRDESMVNGTDGHELNKTGSQHYGGESMVDFANGNEQSRSGSLDAENGFENSFENVDSEVVQAWNSQYFQGESMVVVSQPNYSLDEYGNLGQANGYRPLGLPIRSLNSRIGNLNSSQFSNGIESGTSLSGSGLSDGSGRSVKENDFGDMGPTNLEERFNDTAALPSQIRWRSRSERKEIREKVASSAGGSSHFRPLSVDETQFESLQSQSFRSTTSLLSQGSSGPQHLGPSHFRPLSVDETQFESLKSQSFRSTTSLSSQGSSASYSPSTLSPSHSVSSELPNSETEELGENKIYRASYPPASQSPATRKADAPLNAFHLRRYSSGSLFQKDSRRSLKDELKDLKGKRNEDAMGSREKGQGSSFQKDSRRSLKDELKDLKGKGNEDAMGSRERGQGSLFQKDSRRSLKDELKDLKGKGNEDAMGSREMGQDSLGSDQKPATPVKTSSLTGKSVRTIRASRYAAETIKAGEMSRSHIDDKFGKICDEAQTVNMGKNEMKRGPDNMLIGADKRNSDTQHYMPKPTPLEHKKKENEEYSERVTVESTEESESEIDKSQVSSDEDSMPATNNGAGDDSSEVDKKAGEFIAKFREQIRLQKVASIERSKGKRINGTYVR